MGEKLVFGDPNIILDMARRTPHIIENEHDCNCMHCRIQGDIEGYECSECGEEDDELKYFKIGGEYRCPKCDVELMAPREYKDYLGAKERQYKPLLLKQYIEGNK